MRMAKKNFDWKESVQKGWYLWIEIGSCVYSSNLANECPPFRGRIDREWTGPVWDITHISVFYIRSV